MTEAGSSSAIHYLSAYNSTLTFSYGLFCRKIDEINLPEIRTALNTLLYEAVRY
jgi:hypothetical protein